MAFPSVSFQNTPICIQGMGFISCMHYGALARSKERLSHYCANDMHLLKKHFKTAE